MKPIRKLCNLPQLANAAFLCGQDYRIQMLATITNLRDAIAQCDH